MNSSPMKFGLSEVGLPNDYSEDNLKIMPSRG